MIEGFAREMPEDRMVEAIVAAHGYIRQICEMQEELAAKVGTVKKEYEAPPDNGLADVLRTKFYDALRAAGVKADLHLLPDVGHGDRRFMTPETEKLVNEFVDSVLK